MIDLDFVQPMLACGPLLVAQMALAAGSAVAGYQAQRNQAKATEKQQRTIGNLQLEQSVLNQSDRIQQDAEEKNATVRENLNIQRRTQMAKSTATVSALEGGLGGSVLESLQGEYFQREAELMYASKLQQDMASNRLDRDLARMQKQSQAQLASTYRPINQPSLIASALDAGSDMAGAYADYKVYNS